MSRDSVRKADQIGAYFLDIKAPLEIPEEFIESLLTAAIALVYPAVEVNVQVMGKFEDKDINDK